MDLELTIQLHFCKFYRIKTQILGRSSADLKSTKEDFVNSVQNTV